MERQKQTTGELRDVITCLMRSCTLRKAKRMGVASNSRQHHGKELLIYVILILAQKFHKPNCNWEVTFSHQLLPYIGATPLLLLHQSYVGAMAPMSSPLTLHSVT